MVVEKTLILGSSVVLALFFKPIFQKLILNTTLFTETPWRNLNWISERPWGTILGFALLVCLIYSFMFLLMGVFQNIARLFLERQISPSHNYSLLQRRTETVKTAPNRFPWHFYYLFLHPHRRLAWITSSLETNNRLQQFVVEQREKRLSEVDNRHITGFWVTIKVMAWFLIFASWFLSLWNFYLKIYPVVQGSGNLNMIGLYFAKSFRIFLHVLVITLVAFVSGALAKKVWDLHLFHLDEAIFDEVISKIETDKYQIDKILNAIKEALIKLESRIARLEKSINVGRKPG